MRIVITGASGNVGTALLRRLAEDGGHELVGLVRRPPGDDAPLPAAEWVRVDLTDDADAGALRAACEGADAVVHLAWGFQPSHREDHLRELGVGGTRRVIDAVVATGVPHLVHMSSVGAYSPKHDDSPVDETWPTAGVPTSMYSRHKAAAERLLDRLETDFPGVVVTRMRPGIIGQRDAGSALLRYGLPALVPSGVLRHVPVLPIDERLVISMVHADDVADAFARVLAARAPGAFNLSAPPPVTAHQVADVLGARLVHVPSGVVRAAVSASWHARLQPVDPGWIDMGYAVPLLDSTRARTELGWSPTTDAVSVLAETLEGMQEAGWSRTPVLRPRSVAGGLLRTLRRGPVSSRREP
ncbi:NAD-dependent epimerase/dehydratase family protein [Nocardioides sp. zg-1228]|uniref:NAD-dependent epimerase/dehydratase family protein n=1 Tax=Nocardioides sp. zg-1228 TaxID=2763008 RepID=UPI0016430837|nr:NAD-dependent epimerase/dehydratase family protein [Nocardioides sp. zg-1228]MBC2934932.1 NAD-dependent epimerase/dehydratase family protein [Nocardioides sp. zg-1228]QSF56110.1 NAD-dependent epimerase/dehydratase family protein [Nocardioides sp. zg-1228]